MGEATKGEAPALKNQRRKHVALASMLVAGVLILVVVVAYDGGFPLGTRLAGSGVGPEESQAELRDHTAQAAADERRRKGRRSLDSRLSGPALTSDNERHVVWLMSFPNSVRTHASKHSLQRHSGSGTVTRVPHHAPLSAHSNVTSLRKTPGHVLHDFKHPAHHQYFGCVQLRSRPTDRVASPGPAWHCGQPVSPQAGAERSGLCTHQDALHGLLRRLQDLLRCEGRLPGRVRGVARSAARQALLQRHRPREKGRPPVPEPLRQPRESEAPRSSNPAAGHGPLERRRGRDRNRHP
jgi:hypothetical protein